jgi:hypothetical protein
MSLTFLLLQAANLALAGASLWIHFRAPGLWDDQAMVYSTVTGTFLASLTAVVLGAAMLLSSETRWKSTLANLLLTLVFASGQGYLLYQAGRETGLIQLLRLKFG